MGTPGPTLLAKITSEEARRFMASLPVSVQRDFVKVFPKANPLGMCIINIIISALYATV